METELTAHADLACARRSRAPALAQRAGLSRRGEAKRARLSRAHGRSSGASGQAIMYLKRASRQILLLLYY